MKKRIFALVMSVCMLISMMPVSAIASNHVHDASCGYVEAHACDHTHNTECGYAEAVEGSACGHDCSDGTCAYKAAIEGTPCNHSCDYDVCGFYPAIPGTPCDKGCSDIVDGEIQHVNCDYSEGEPEMPCNHTHDDSCSYVAPVAEVACDHQHDANCGYAEAVEAQPCTHEHDTTCGYTEGSDCNYVEPIEEATTYYVSVNSANPSWGELSGMGYYAPSDTVTISANPYDGYHFYTWVVAQGSITLADEDAQTTTFTMPEENVTITANLREHGFIMDRDNGDGTHSGSCLFCDVKGEPEAHTLGAYEDNGESGHYANCDKYCGYQTELEPHVYDGDADTECDVCSHIREVHIHEWGDWESNEDGTHTRTCTADESHTDTETCAEYAVAMVDEQNHNILCECMYVLGTEAHTMSEWFLDGEVEHRHCTAACGYFEERSIETHTHTWEWTYDSSLHWQVCGDPDCSESSTAAQAHQFDSDSDATCDTCGYTRTIEPAHVHSYTAATCTTPATCSDPTCGETKGDVDKSNHVGGTEIRNQVDAGEFSEGYTGDTYCKGCGDKLAEGETIPATHQHSYTAVVTEPTCSDRGYTTYTCSCNDSYVSDYVDAFGHDWGDYVSIGNGRHTRVCRNDSSHEQTMNCGGTATCHELAFCPDCKTTYGEYDQRNHSGGTEVRNSKEATETEDGYTGDTYCLGCNVLIAEGSIIYATGSGDDDDDTHTHNYSYYKFDGTNHWKMCNCGQGQAGSVKPHSLVITGISTGHFEECTVCDYYSDVEAHVYSDDSDAYCNECGYRRHVHDYSTAATCSSPAKCGCGATTGSKDPSNHTGGTEIRNAKEATETENGYTGDTYCKGCGAKLASGKRTNKLGFVDVKYDDDVVVKEVTFQPIKGVTLLDDAEVIVEDHTATIEPVAAIVGSDDEIEYITVPDSDIYVSDPPVVLNGVTYYMNEFIAINGEEFLVVDTDSDSLQAMRLSDSVEFSFDGEKLIIFEQFGNKVEKRENQKLNINGVTYDVVAVRDGFSSLDISILYYKGQPAGQYRSETGVAAFNSGYDPATLKAQRDDIYLGRVTADNTSVVDLTPGKTYNVSVIGSNDIHLEGAENVGGTVTQTFEVPAEFVGNENVKFIAVHDTNPHATALAAAKLKMEEAWANYLEYHGDSYEEAQRLFEAANRAEMACAIVQVQYDAWEKEHAADTGTGNDLGAVTIAEDGKTLTATYTVSSFSPFTVYAFTEAELPEIKEFVTQPDGTLVRVVNGQPVTTHTVASGENLTVIARKYGCTVDEIVALNSDLIENPRLIFAGWVLTIPAR